MERRRSTRKIVVASTLATLGMAGLTSALAQQPGTPAAGKPAASQAPTQVELKKIPVNPSDPIAVVNGEPITRQQLADECVARKGEEVLDALIARKLIDQAIRARNLEVTAAEVNSEIDRIAMDVAGVSREQWLATLAKERKISPSQYARDVIHPMIAMRKLAEPRVQVTEEDIQDGFDAKFGEQLQCRMIMFNDQRKAIETWEELKKDPNLFEKLARDRSIDPSTASVGGMLPHPITRHAYPRHVSDSAFEQLVDGVVLDSKLPGGGAASVNDTYKPKDGDMSGVIQINEAAWVILRREGLIAAREYDPNDQAVREELRKALFDAKLQEEVSLVWTDIMDKAAIENRLTGNIKPTGEAVAGNVAAPDDQVQRTTGTTTGGDIAAPTGPKLPTPAAVSPADARQAESLRGSKP